MNAPVCLGTAAIGMEYGLANRTGKPTRDQAFEIIERAISGGVTWIDTAAAYGDAEETLGAYGAGSVVNIVTKLRPNLFDSPAVPILETILREMDESMGRLLTDQLDGYLLHSSRYVFRPEIVEAMLDAAGRNNIGLVGVSCYEPAEVWEAIRAGFTAVQVPYSVLDQRCEAAMAAARARGMTVFARAPWIQGLLTMGPTAVPAHLSHVLESLRRYRSWVVDQMLGSQLSALCRRLALRFALDNPHKDYVVFGVETADQLEEDLDEANRGKIRPELWLTMRAAFRDIPEAVVNPSLWAKPAGNGNRAESS